MKKIVIIGGGVAGLSALNRLADLGVSATLVESGSYPSHKICGEFFSPECLAILKDWNICPEVEINKIFLNSQFDSLNFSLPSSARSESRYEFDEKLAMRALDKGANLLTHTKVKKIESHRVILENGNELIYSDLIVSAGRFFGGSFEPEYYGIKGHLKGIEIYDQLEMYSFLGGYAGLSPLGRDKSNFACLVHKNFHIESNFLDSVLKKAPLLKKRLECGSLLFDDWMVCPVPKFGVKQINTELTHTYFIGDAAGTIPPASGLGLSLGITSGVLVADFAIRGDNQGFKKAWDRKYKKTFFQGQLLHRLMMNSTLLNIGLKSGQLFSKLAPRLFEISRITTDF